MESLSSIGMVAETLPCMKRRGRRSPLMPDLSTALPLLDATVFLYPSRADAEKGSGYGGSGVIIGLPVPNRPDLVFRYAVTNWHVACQSGSSVIRMKDGSGNTHIIELEPDEWSFIPGGPDLAVAPLKLPSSVAPRLVHTDLFVDPTRTGEVFLGDDLFMAGRFVDFDGKETNRPALRFGALSMTDASVRQPTGYSGHSYIADLHSRTGYSGSPVYVWRSGASLTANGMPIMAFGAHAGGDRTISNRGWGAGNNTSVKLLGIQWGQFPERWEIGKAPSKLESAQAPLISEGAYVSGFSGMSCIVPAQEILRVLNLPELARLRENPPEIMTIPMPEGLMVSFTFPAD